MKKAAAGCFAVACVVAVLVAILASIGQMREAKIQDLPPLTLQELDQLSKALKKTEVPAKDPVSPPNPTDESPAEARSSDEISPANLPRRLNQAATDEQRREIFTRGRKLTSRLIAIIGSSPVGGLIDSISVAAGIPEGASANRAESNLIRGNWAEAKSCYTEFVRKCDNVRAQHTAYAFLAWLEEDPELAARYMELASSGGDLFPVRLCRDLARETGSMELADYYQALFEQSQKSLPPVDQEPGP